MPQYITCFASNTRSPSWYDRIPVPIHFRISHKLTKYFGFCIFPAYFSWLDLFCSVRTLATRGAAGGLNKANNCMWIRQDEPGLKFCKILWTLYCYKARPEISAEYCRRGHHRQDFDSSRCRCRHRDCSW